MNKREHILKVAEALFAEHGFEGTSVRALSKKAGVNIAMISYYFGSKEKLFEAIVEYRGAFLRKKLKGVHKAGADPSKNLEKAINLVVDRVFSNPDFHRLLHREISLEQRSKMTSNIVEVLMLNMEELKKIIKKGIKKKVFREVDVEMLLCTIFSTTSQAAQYSLLTERILDLGKKNKQGLIESLKERTKIYLSDLLKNYLSLKNKHF